jgi:hypothetical protein
VQSIRLIGDGDVAGIIHTTDPDETGIDLYAGIGGAPEGVLAAAALRCIGGQMQARLVITREEQVERAHRMGIEDIKKKYTLAGNGGAGCSCCGNRRDRRQLAAGGPLRSSPHHDPHRGHAVFHRHGSLHQGPAHGAGKIPPGLDRISWEQAQFTGHAPGSFDI